MSELEVNCGNCLGACCRKGTFMTLSEEEAAYLGEGGTELTELNEVFTYTADPLLPDQDKDPDHLELARFSEYRLDADCGYLTEVDGAWLCAIHEDPKRPYVCQKFEPGSDNCRWIRVRRGVDMPDETAAKLEVNLNALNFDDGSGEFDVFAKDELTYICEQNLWLYPLVAQMAETIEHNRGEAAGRKILAGVLYAHRLLRYSNDNQALPEKTKDDFVIAMAPIKYGSAQAIRPNGSKLEKSFRDAFGANEELVTFVYERLREPMCQYGIEIFLLVYKNDLDPCSLRLFQPVPLPMPTVR